MVDVMIEALSAGPRVRIKCNSHVRKIAVYENLVAVKVNNSFVVYERSTADGESVQYAIKSHMAINRECDLLQVLSTPLIFPPLKFSNYILECLMLSCMQCRNCVWTEARVELCRFLGVT